MNDTDILNSEYIKEEIVAEKRICYYSSFDLNINDWFTEYENILIFS